ncbi:MAG TPA: hypothetical protein VKY85_06615 [Candidatus Angelobacter sp.]|nr:hypothetical protein [Candidatus Angelobacter sp.]
MKTLSLIACCSLVALFTTLGSPEANDLAGWAEQAVSPDQSIAQKAQDHLRGAGPQGLHALQQRFAKEILAHQTGAPADARWRRIGAALDRVGGQYDNYASGLYWYTDLEKAKAAAQESGRPILSLRLLGHLDEDLSCANSRFFRTTLYPSVEVNQLLKDRFILHWESVRPAPKVTIDFGDGRKLDRTITGNSIHYVLDSQGTVVDALPGLYSAPVFVSELRQAADAARPDQPHVGHDYTQHLKSTESRLLQAWAADLSAIRVSLPANQTFTESDLEHLMDDQKWQQVAQLPTNPVSFDLQVSQVMERKMPAPRVVAAQRISGAKAAGANKFPQAGLIAQLTMSKSAVESPMLRAMRNLANTVAVDTVRNNYMLRTKILAFLAGPGARSISLAQLNDWVYGQVFLTPREDPWLGLAPQGVFSAIDRNGESR